MSDLNPNGYSGGMGRTADMSMDMGLRKFMLGVYNKLALGLVVAAALAWVVGNVPAVQQLLFVQTPNGISMTLLGMAVQFAPLVLIFGSMFFMKRPTPVGTNLLYWAVVATMGASLGWIFLIYAGGSIVSTFLIMGVIGLVVASIVNIFLQSPILYWISTFAGVLIFSGLIAFDTQRLKLTYYQLQGDEAAMSVATSWGALGLFINFVNLFMFLLRIFGASRN